MSDLKLPSIETPVLTSSARMSVEVKTSANPISGVLRLARMALMEDPGMVEVFREAKGQPAEWLKSRILPFLETYFGAQDKEVEEVATYLADETFQLGEGQLLISSTTGRALARITDADFYQPAPVLRESGNLVERPRAIRPEIEGQIIQWTFDRDFEDHTTMSLASRLPSGISQEAEERKLSFSTLAGRQALVQRLKEDLPQVLPSCRGIARTFLEFFPLAEGTHPLTSVRIEVSSEYKAPMQDPTARNLSFDVETSVRSGIATSWVRAAAKGLFEATSPSSRPSQTVGEAFVGRASGLWIGSENVHMAFLRSVGQTVPFLAVPGLPDSEALFVREPAGVLQVNPDTFWVRSREVRLTWRVEADLGATLWFLPSKVERVALEGVAVGGQSVEGV